MTYREHPAPDYRAVVDGSTQLVDVREPAEFAGGSLPGAVNMPLSSFDRRARELDPRRRTVLLCQSGRRSGRAAHHLASLGHRDVVNLAGGITTVA